MDLNEDKIESVVQDEIDTESNPKANIEIDAEIAPYADTVESAARNEVDAEPAAEPTAEPGSEPDAIEQEKEEITDSITNDSPEEVSPAAAPAPKKSRKPLIAVIAAVIVVALIFFSYIQPKVIKPMQEYNTAVSLLEEGKYDQAEKIFKSLGDYKDSAHQIDNCKVAHADSLVEKGQSLNTALDIYTQYGTNENVTATKIRACKEKIYQNAVAQYEDKEYVMAKGIFETISDYSDSSDYIDKCDKAIKKAEEEKKRKEEEEKRKEEERKAAEEAKAKEEEARKAAGFYSGGINGTLDEIMAAYIDEYSGFVGRVVDSIASGRVALIEKDNSYGGQLTCGHSSTNLTIMFSGTDSAGENETSSDSVPGKIVVLCDRPSDSGDLACAIMAMGNLLCVLNPQLNTMDAADAVLTAIDSGSNSIGGISISGAATSDYLLISVQ